MGFRNGIALSEMAPGKDRVSTKEKNAHLWVRDEHDYYAENEWVSAALFRQEEFSGCITDPCCGRGRILNSARACGYETAGSDVVERGDIALSHPFVLQNYAARLDGLVKNVVSNPPFKDADDFVDLVRRVVRRKAAILLPAQWANAVKRSRRLSVSVDCEMPLARVLVLSPRPSMPPGAVVDAGEKVGGGTKDFAWFVFIRDHLGPPQFGWAWKDPRP